MTFGKTNEMIKEEMPQLVHLTVNKDQEFAPTNVPHLISKEFAIHGPQIIEELFRKHMQNTTLNLYPITSLLTAEISTIDLQQQLYLNMKSKPQDQAADPELWEILKAKFEEQYVSTSSYTYELFACHDEHHTDDDPLEGGVRAKRYFGNCRYLVRIIVEFIISKMCIENYQIKVNLTKPTLTFLGIEAHKPYLIIDKPSTGLIYLNNKDEKWVMYLVEIVKFYVATFGKVLKEVKLKIFQSETLKKSPLLGELDRDIMKACERETSKRLSHRQ
ncbi:hypothetical protein Tco_1063718 [Tanacetum coccineum]